MSFLLLPFFPGPVLLKLYGPKPDRSEKILTCNWLEVMERASFTFLKSICLQISFALAHQSGCSGQSNSAGGFLAFRVIRPLARSWGLIINKAMNFSAIYYTNYWLWWLLPPVFSLVVTLYCLRLLTREIENIVYRSEL